MAPWYIHHDTQRTRFKMPVAAAEHEARYIKVDFLKILYPNGVSIQNTYRTLPNPIQLNQHNIT